VDLDKIRKKRAEVPVEIKPEIIIQQTGLVGLFHELRE